MVPSSEILASMRNFQLGDFAHDFAQFGRRQMALVDGRAHHRDDGAVAFLATGDRLRITLAADQGQDPGEKFAHVHAGAFVVKHAFDENAQGHDAADEEHHHQRAAPLHHLEQPDFFFDRCDVAGLRKESGDHGMFLVSVTK
jgi:hypothetical protein